MLKPHVRALVIGAVAVLWFSDAAAAGQAFVPPKGEGSVTIEWQGGIIKRHLTMTGPKDSGQVDSQGLLTDFSVGLGRGFAVSVGLPLIEARYIGTKPHTLLPSEVPLYPTFKTLDDGAYHASFQDVHAEVRRSLRFGRVAVTPFVGVVIPSHQYESLSHAAVGRDVRELQVGAYAGGAVAPWPGGFFQAGYFRGFEQTVIDIPRQRDVVTFEGGHFATTRWRFYGTGAWQMTHGGIDIQVSARELHGEEYINHDRIVRTNLLDLGVGTAYRLTDRVDLLASVSRTVWGVNGHAQWGVVNIGFSYGLGPSRRAPLSLSDGQASCDADDRASQLQKCVCLRK
jgi:hypothetical protein